MVHLGAPVEEVSVLDTLQWQSPWRVLWLLA